MESLKEKTARGLLWGGVSNGIQQLLNLVFGIFLARLLTQSDYGMVGMLTVFSAIGTVLQEGGFIAALNKRKNAGHADYNAVFWACTLVSVSFYTLLFVCAPLIARFYGIGELTPLARFVFLSFVISSLNVAPRAMLFRQMRVRETALTNIISLLISGCVAVVMALRGFAYWGIATQTIVYMAMVTVLSYYYTGWRPTLPVDFRPVKEMFGFSSRLIVTNLCNVVNNNLFAVILGRLYTPVEVGNFTQANKWTTMGHSLITSMVYGVAQPVFTRVEDDRERQRNVFRKLLRFTAFICFPLMFGLMLTAQEFIVILITEKWLSSARIMQVLCVGGAFLPISNLFSNLIISRGHSSVYMWCTIALCITEIATACLLAPLGIMTMVSAYVAVQVAWLLVWHYHAHREIGVRLGEVLRDIAPYLLLSLALIALAHFITQPIEDLYLRFAAKVALVAAGYVGVLWCLKSVILREAADFLLHHKIHND